MRTLVLASLLVLTPALAAADTLEFDLPGVVGAYDETTMSRLDTLTYTGTEVLMISGVSVAYTGAAATGWAECPDSWGVPQPTLWGLSVDAYVRRSGAAAYWACWSSIDQSGPFAVTAPGNIAGFNKLNPGDQIVVTQYFPPWALVALCTPLLPSPSGVIESATLRIQTDPPLAVEKSTWGRIKALYR